MEGGLVALLGIDDDRLNGFSLGGEFGNEVGVCLFKGLLIQGLSHLLGSGPLEDAFNSSVSSAGDLD